MGNDGRAADGQGLVVRPAGRLDLAAALDFRQQVQQLVGAGSARLVLDLSEVSFLDSSGLMAIISGLKQTRQAGGDLRIAGPSQQAKLVLELSSLDQVLPIYPSVEEAQEGFN